MNRAQDSKHNGSEVITAGSRRGSPEIIGGGWAKASEKNKQISRLW
jgi:hypothetical protein